MKRSVSLWRSVTRKDQRLLLLQLLVTAGMMYQHLSSFEPLYLKYDTFCEYAALAQEEVRGSWIASISLSLQKYS